MPLSRNPRQGTVLELKQRPLPFSFWPVDKTTRRYSLQSHVFATNPWAVIVRSVTSRCPGIARAAALAFVNQAQDFYNAGTRGGVVAAKPVLLYYCFLNLVKAYILTLARAPSLDKAKHGLSEKLVAPGTELQDALLRAHPSTPNELNIFDEFLATISGKRLTKATDFYLQKLLPQIIVGHRLWVSASDESERFVSVEKIEFVQNKDAKNIWLRFYLFEDDLSRLDVSHERLLDEARLSSEWRNVRYQQEYQGRRLLCFEQRDVINYSHQTRDKVPQLADTLRLRLWATIRNLPPYRRYYLYMSPRNDRPFVLPQLLSIYAIMFYLGSITRYRPHQFEKVISGEYGAVIQEFLTNQPMQFIYLLASNLAQREIARAAIV